MKLFVHIPKNGGMAIRRCKEINMLVATRGNHISGKYSDELLATMLQHGEHHGYEHARWRDWRVDLREKYKAFAVVRNPWARTVSRFTFAKVAMSNKKFEFPEGWTFSDFLGERHTYGGRKFYWHRAIRGWYPQKDYVTDEAGALRCDVLRQEHLNDEAADYLKLDGSLDNRNVSAGVLKDLPVDYREYYNDVDHQIVADWYADDIEYFGFTFEGAATRHTWA